LVKKKDIQPKKKNLICKPLKKSLIRKMPEKRRAAASAKAKLKEVGEDGGRGGGDDSDEDPDFDHVAAEKEKKRQKKLEEEKEREKEKSSSSSSYTPGKPGRPAGRPVGGGGGGRSGYSQVGRKRPLGNNIKCPFCDEGFNTVEIVMEHMMASHENDKRYVCKMCSKPDGPPREFPFRNNMEEHMTKEHNHQWTKRDKYDPLEEKPISFRVKQAAKFCVVPKENATYKEDLPKPKVPRCYSNMTRNGNEKPAKIHCPHAPKCTQFFYNDDPRVLVDHVMSEHLKLHRYHCSKCGPSLTFNTHTDFTNHGKEKHKINNPQYNDHFTDIYLVCQRVPEEAIRLLNLTPDDVDAIESMGRGCEDEQEEEVEEENDDLVMDEKWDVCMRGIRVTFLCVECDTEVEGRSGVVQHNREKHDIHL